MDAAPPSPAGDECPVCLEPLAARIAARPPCGHEVCLGCLLRLAAPRRCPMCRAPLDVPLPPPRPLTRSAPVVTLRRPPLLADGDDDAGGEPALRALIDRVRHMEVLDDALANGAAPRNAVYATRLLPATPRRLAAAPPALMLRRPALPAGLAAAIVAAAARPAAAEAAAEAPAA